MRATIKDIAKKTGLSVGTVSRYLNGYKLKKNNEVKISNAIEELNFRVNGYARFLKTKRSKMIGLIIPSVQLTFASEIVHVLEKKFSKHGYSMMITIIPDSSQNSLDKLTALEIYSPEGLIVIPPADNKGLIGWLINIGKVIPTIVLDRILPGFKNTEYILIDNKVASKNAVQYLVNNGHEKIGVITGDKRGFTTEERIKGYFEVIEANNFTYSNNISSDYTREGGYKAVSELMNSHEKPTAIFTTNYDMTLGALHFFNDNYIKVGEDISLIGFDLDAINGIFPKKIAMVLQPINEMARYTANKLINTITYQDTLEGQTIFECEYISGETVRDLKHYI